ncbi:hypothetical protein JL720_16069 [Aureococcus anophagefferens]|nr:hypothetical protein JL720_16069 [Aureococcus anophagefferens]
MSKRPCARTTAPGTTRPPSRSRRERSGARLRAAIARRRLVYGVIGYSITVGRGNYFNQSWPAAERRLAAPGVAVEVRNMAVGASPPYPTCACLAETVGSDVDVFAWEFGMTGATTARRICSVVPPPLELPSRPAFVLIDSQTRRTDVLRRLGALSTVVNLRRAFSPHEDGDGDRWAKQGMPEGCKAAKWHPGVGWHDLTAAALAWHHATAVLAADDGAAAAPREIRKAGMGSVLHDAWTCRTSMLPRHDAGADLGSIVASRLNAASLDGGWAVAMAPRTSRAHHMNEDALCKAANRYATGAAPLKKKPKKGGRERLSWASARGRCSPGLGSYC